jgi:signal transduction histidine kinase
VGNLLSNAIKYSPEGGTVELAAKRSDSGVRVIVRDEGLGIPEDQQERIFTKFFRGDAGATGITGTGLGLAVSREIVEAHGGSIGFDSDPATGSTFWVELPEEPGAGSANNSKETP